MNPNENFYWTNSTCGNYFFLIAPFGYGPRIAAETLSKKIDCTLNKWQKSNQLPEYVSCKYLFNFGVSDFNIEIVNCVSKIWVDCLMWMRKGLNKIEISYDYILAENFFGESINELKNDNIIFIPPLSDFNKNAVMKKTLQKIVISFGGVETPFTTDFHRFFIPFLTLSSAISIFQKYSINYELIVCIPSHLIEQFKSKFDESINIHFISPSHQEYLKLIDNADKLILQPGLYGPFEAFFKEIPTYFVTPFSYTQLMQAIEFDKNEILSDVPVFDQVKSIAVNFSGNIELEEENCFIELEKCMTSIGNEQLNYSFNQWMENIVIDKNIAELTRKRVDFVKRNITNSNLRLNEFLIILNNKLDHA